MSAWWLLTFYPFVAIVLAFMLMQFTPKHDWYTFFTLFGASMGWGYLVIMILYDYIRSYKIRKKVAKQITTK